MNFSKTIAARVWMGAVCAAFCAVIVLAFLLPQSFRLTACSDLLQSFLLASATAAFIPLIWRSQGRLRLFWTLIALGIGFWFSYQLLWTYYEVLLRRDVPDIFAGDVVLFLNLVPMIAALALRPHVPPDEFTAPLGLLDFALLLVWWLYLYVLAVMPWAYVVPDADTYNRNLNAVYLVEKLAYLAALAACWAVSSGHWKRLYAGLFGASFSYAASSYVANWAIARKIYYSGSLYDVPLAFSMAWLTWIGLHADNEESEPSPSLSTAYGVWIARFGMIAAFSLSLFAAWSVADSIVPPRIRGFRLALTFAAAFVMGLMVFVRQNLLDRELLRLLSQSEESVENLDRLRAQILQSEKLASVGQLVGGAAHELNNPITAMLGYTDLLLNTELTSEQSPLATKIGHHVRRTRSLVASLISFARTGPPAPKGPVDLNTLARTAVKLTQPQWEAQRIAVHARFDPELPRVLGDSNQLLQVCLQLVGNCLHMMAERGEKLLTISTQRQAGVSLLLIATDPTFLRASAPQVLAGAGDPSELRNEEWLDESHANLGLSACQGILHEHGGNVAREDGEHGAILLRVELPAVEVAPVRTRETATVPVLWQSRPFA